MINVHNERESFKFQAETDPKVSSIPPFSVTPWLMILPVWELQEKGIPKILAQKRPDLQALDGQYSVVDVQQYPFCSLFLVCFG